MISTAMHGLPLPEPTDPDQVPYHLGLLAAAIESRLVGRWNTEGARNAAIATPQPGMLSGVGARTQSWDGSEWVDIGLGLPDPVAADGPGGFTTATQITSGSFAALPSPVAVTLTLPARALVAIEFAAWLVGLTGTDVRVGVIASGATSFGTGSTGQILYSGDGPGSHSNTRHVICEAGSTTLTLQAMRAAGAGAVYANYCHLTAAAVRWA